MGSKERGAAMRLCIKKARHGQSGLSAPRLIAAPQVA